MSGGSVGDRPVRKQLKESWQGEMRAWMAVGADEGMDGSEYRVDGLLQFTLRMDLKTLGPP